MKALQFRSRKKSVPFEHPEGGTFFLFPFDTERQFEYADQIQTIAQSSDKRSKQYLDAAKWVAENVVDRIGDVVDYDSQQPIEVDDEIKLQILLQISDRDVEREFPVFDETVDPPKPKIDEKGELVTVKKNVPANEPYFVWALGKAGELLRRREAEVKNS